MEQKFEYDWFSFKSSNWKNYLSDYKDKENLNFLEIGSHEGRSCSWLLDNILTHETSRMHCVDIFYDDGYEKKFGESLKTRFFKNTKKYGEKIILHEEWSFDFLTKENIKKEKYDFIYVDGNHSAKCVIEDSVLSFRLLKSNGILIFDDYDWNKNNLPPEKRPEIAIDAFLQIYKNLINVLYSGSQVIIKKI